MPSTWQNFSHSHSIFLPLSRITAKPEYDPTQTKNTDGKEHDDVLHVLCTFVSSLSSSCFMLRKNYRSSYFVWRNKYPSKFRWTVFLISSRGIMQVKPQMFVQMGHDKSVKHTYSVRLWISWITSHLYYISLMTPRSEYYILWIRLRNELSSKAFNSLKSIVIVEFLSRSVVRNKRDGGRRD